VKAQAYGTPVVDEPTFERLLENVAPAGR
jgi:hypothetical protein